MRTALAALLALALGACNADLHVDRVCLTPQGISVAGLPPGSGTRQLPDLVLAFDFSTTVPDLQKDGVHDVHAWARSLELSSTAGLGFIQSLTVSVDSPSGPVTLAELTGSPGDVNTVTIPANGTDVYGNLQNGILYVTISNLLVDRAQTPTTLWTVGTTLCAEVQGSVDYFKAAGL
jgi:hypothetical protein